MARKPHPKPSLKEKKGGAPPAPLFLHLSGSPALPKVSRCAWGCSQMPPRPTGDVQEVEEGEGGEPYNRDMEQRMAREREINPGPSRKGSKATRRNLQSNANLEDCVFVWILSTPSPFSPFPWTDTPLRCPQKAPRRSASPPRCAGMRNYYPALRLSFFFF